MIPFVFVLPVALAAPQTFDFSERTALSLTLPAGNVTVVEGEALSVSLTETDWSDRCRVKTSEQSAAIVEVVQPRKAQSCAADVVVTLPEGARLRLALTEGDVALQQTDGLIDLLVDTGNITLDQTNGSVFASIGTGALSGTAMGGLLANLGEGSVAVSWAGLPTGDIHVQTRAGDVELTLPADVSLTNADRQPASFRAILPDEKTVQADARRGAVTVSAG